MKKFLLTTFLLSIILYSSIEAAYYTNEQKQAYDYSFSKNITSRDTIDKAGMNQYVTRSQIAKMLSNWAKSIWREIDKSKSCIFSDIETVNSELTNAIIESCQLGILGQWTSKFRPYDNITRAEVATAVSRILWWSKNNWGSPYYLYHMTDLINEWIIDNMGNVKGNETRWNVMIMLMKADRNLQLSPNKLLKDLASEGNTIHYIDENYLEEDSSNWEEYGCYWNSNSSVCSVITISYDNWKLANWIYVTKYNNGKIREIASYKNWRLNGDRYFFYENWQLSSKYWNKEWKIVWESVSYHQNWQLQNSDMYDDEWYMVDGIHTRYYDDWNIRSQTAYKSWAPVYDIWYYRNGNRMRVVKLEWGSPIWEELSYYENGKLKESIVYSEWRPDGKSTTYYENGNIESEWYYENWWKEWAWTIYNDKWIAVAVEKYHYWQLESRENI